MPDPKKIRTRIAPSPTGSPHIGLARTALFNWLNARRHNGRFVLRFEDTDRDRSTLESMGVIQEAMTWLGLTADEGPYRQMDRLDRYHEVAEQMLASGHAYKCYCTKDELEQMRAEQKARSEKPRYDGRCRPDGEGQAKTTSSVDAEYVIRFANPTTGEASYDDLVYGTITMANQELDDVIMVRSNGVPTYNFAVVVDDHDMDITHVIRGEEHINNTPRQVNMYQALGWSMPVMAHLPMILGSDGKKLSKRHGAVNVIDYREQGILPAALLSYLVRLGWSHGDQEIFSIEEMIELFDVADVNKSAATFDIEKLTWVNQHFIKTMSTNELVEPVGRLLSERDVEWSQGPDLETVIASQQERAKTLVEMADNSLFFYRDFDSFQEKAAKQHLRPVAEAGMRAVRTGLAALEDWSEEAIHGVIHAVADLLELKLGKVAQPIRVAVSGGPISPPIDITLKLLGKEKTLARLDQALEFIAKRAEAA
ncbi:MAG: glutamate--tRNA ligase [Gammaproteobacteria bacterium]|nr:glutamate--tRNA ligase [Gammaproteobacteria bacterium]